jgi:hypothetical protein
MLKKFAGIEWYQKNVVLELLLLSLLITPFQNLIDLLWMFTSRSFEEEWSVNHSPGAVKALKDLILVLLLVILFFMKKQYTKANKILFGIFVFILGISIARSFTQGHSIFLSLSGIRWYLPLLLFPLFDEFNISLESVKSLISRYRFIIIAALVLQIFQILFSHRWGTCAGIGCRANGFFAMPQPMSIFALFFLIFVLIIPPKKKLVDYGIPILSILLSKSAAGYLGLIAFFFKVSNKKFRILTVVLGASAIILFPVITGRTGYWLSPLTRIDILKRIDYSNIIFGMYRNACHNFQQKVHPITCAVPDSFLASLLGNLGLFFAICGVLVIFFYIWKSNKPLTLASFIILLAAGSYTEYFPMNIFFPFLIGFRIDNPSKEVTSPC